MVWTLFSKLKYQVSKLKYFCVILRGEGRGKTLTSKKKNAKLTGNV